MRNVASTEFDTTVYSDCPTEKHYSVSNLLKHDGCGVLCPSVVHPPVNFLFCLPKAAELCVIVVKPHVQRHLVGSLSIFLLHETICKTKTFGCSVALSPTDLIQRANTIPALLSVTLDNRPANTVVAVNLKNDQGWPPSSLLNGPYNVHEVHTVIAPFRRVCGVLLRINRMASTKFVPCLGAVELWCSYPESPINNPPPDIEQEHPIQPLRNSTTDEECIRAPEEFFDPITGDLLTDPIRLPSGTRVNRTTLARFNAERLQAQPNATVKHVDPFTMVPLDEHDIQSDYEMKQSVEEHLARWKRLKDLCDCIDNRSFLFPSPSNFCISQLSTSSDSESDS